MPRVTLPIGPDGLLLPVMVGLDQQATAGMLRTGGPVTRPVTTVGLIDTGSDVTCVAPAVLGQLGLAPLAQTRTTTAAGPVAVNLFRVSLGLPPTAGLVAPHVVAGSLLVMELPHRLPVPGIEVVVGLDVLLGCRLLIDGPARAFTLDV